MPMKIHAVWEDLPCTVLMEILARVGVKNLPNSFQVCKSWWGVSKVESFWSKVLSNEFGVLRPALPAKFESWQEYVRYLWKQNFFLIEIGVNKPSLIRLKDECGDVSVAKGVTEIKLTDIRIWVGSHLKSRYVFMCLMASQELLMWYVTNVTEPLCVPEGMQSYTAPFKRKNAVVGFAVESCGALALTVDGHLYDTVHWSMGDHKGCIAGFERVVFASSAPVISHAISSAGVRAAVLKNGIVFVWGTVCQALVDYIGRDAARIFGLQTAAEKIDHASPPCASIPSPCQVLPDPSTDVKPDLVEVVSGKAHFLVRSKSGSVWKWGISENPKNNADSAITAPPTIIHRSARKLYNGSIVQDEGGHLYACQEYVCQQDSLLWTPMYNLQYGNTEPATPNQWPWKDGTFAAIQMGDCEIGENGWRGDAHLHHAYTRYSTHGAGCIRIHIYSSSNCRVYSRPVRVLPMFDVGPDIYFGSKGNMYFGSRGQIVMKNISQSMARDQFYLIDLRQLGINGVLVSVQKACGLLVATIMPEE